jgi:predicted phage tail protein
MAMDVISGTLNGETGEFKRQDQSRNYVRFHLHPVLNEVRTKAEGRNVFEDVEFVEIAVPGDRFNIVVKAVADEHRYEYARQYAAFKQGKSQDEASGTLLSQWPGVSPARAEEYAYFKVRTVEQLADVNDEVLSRLDRGAREEREKARAYLDAMKAEAPKRHLADELAKRDDLIAQMAKQLEEQGAALEKLTAKKAKQGS